MSAGLPGVRPGRRCAGVRAGRRAALVVVSGLWFAGAGRAGAADVPPPPDPYPKAAAAYLVAVNGMVLWERAPRTALPPASLTKIMTALVLLDGDWDAGRTVTVSSNAARATGSRLALRAGERYRAGDLLTGMLVASGNDACTALAESAAGTVADFVERMNGRALDLGLKGTHFANPCGLDAPGMRSTVTDLHALTRAALEKTAITERMGLARATVRSLDGRSISLVSGNQLLGRVPGAIGVKSGFTSRAGKCLVALARRGDDEVLVILLNAPNRWWSAAVLIEDAFKALADARR